MTAQLRKEMTDVQSLRIALTQKEKDTLTGKQGAVLQKILKTVVFFGEALGAKRLVNITGKGHFVISHAIPGISPSLEMLDALIAADLKTRYPFTLDPIAPLDYENWWLNPDQVKTLDRMYRDQKPYDEKMLQLGLWNHEAYTCTPYLPEIGNLPKRGDVLAWSESTCVVFANSVLGARTNRNGAILDLLCNIIGKAPLSGFLTDEGRQASWRIEVKTEKLPPPQLLGAAIGGKILADVPYIAGLDRFLGTDLNPFVRDYLHEMGAACAAAGAVGLYHVENITPEAIDYKLDLLTGDYRTLIIDEDVLRNLLRSYPVLWNTINVKPEKCYLGCPHLSSNQLEWWAKKIHERLKQHGTKLLKVKTTICSAPQVLAKFRKNKKVFRKLSQAGVRFSAACPMQLFDNAVSKDEAIITNSNKLRTYTPARFFPDEEIVGILVTGEILEGE
jgi:predicted aconitase